MHTGACPGGRGAPRGLASSLEIEKQKKKKKKKVIRANFKLFSPIFCHFFSRKFHFFSYFLSWAPPEKLKRKKKKGFQILGPPFRIPGHAPGTSDQIRSDD